jgi:hypothetical protein
MEPTSTSPTRRNTAWAGIVFAVLYVVGVIMAASSPSDTDKYKDNAAKLTATWRTYYSDSGHRWTIIIGAWIIVGAVLALIVFASDLRDRLAEAGAPSSGRLAFGASILFGAVTMSGASAIAWIPGAKQFGSSPLPTNELNYLGSQLGFPFLLLGGGAAAALLLVSAGKGAARTGALPAWLSWAGVVIGVLVFFTGVFFLPMALLVLWVLIAAIVMMRKPLAA